MYRLVNAPVRCSVVNKVQTCQKKKKFNEILCFVNKVKAAVVCVFVILAHVSCFVLRSVLLAVCAQTCNGTL